MEVAIKYALTHLVAINVLVKKDTHWISMVSIAVVCTYVCIHMYACICDIQLVKLMLIFYDCEYIVI